MEIHTRGIRDAGVLVDERVVIDVDRDVNIGDYVTAFVRDIDKETFSTRMISPIWFPELKLKAGDIVVIYTREGQRNKKMLSDGATAHFFYRNSSVPICGDECIAVVNLKISEWLHSGERL